MIIGFALGWLVGVVIMWFYYTYQHKREVMRRLAKLEAQLKEAK